MRVLSGGERLIVDDLKFESEKVGGAIFYATVASGGDLPFEAELEIEIMLLGDEVAAAFLTRFVEVEDPFLQGPGRRDFLVFWRFPEGSGIIGQEVGPLGTLGGRSEGEGG